MKGSLIATSATGSYPMEQLTLKCLVQVNAPLRSEKTSFSFLPLFSFSLFSLFKVLTRFISFVSFSFK